MTSRKPGSDPTPSRPGRLSSYLTEKTMGALERLRGGAAFTGEPGSGNMLDLLEAVKTFVRREVPEILGQDRRAPIRLEMPLEGSKTMILIITCGSRRALLRAYMPSQRDKADAHIAATRLLRENGVKVPELYYVPEDTSQCMSAILVLEQFIEGEARHAQDLTHDNIRSVARQLAKLHTTHGPGWGRLNQERTDSFFSDFMGRVHRDLATLEGRDLLTVAERRTMAQWFSRYEPLFASNKQFSLTHNDLHADNGLFTADGSYYFIDVGRLQWDIPTRETVRAYYRLFDGDPKKVKVFNEAYFGAMSHEDVEYISQYLPVYESFYRVITAVKLTKQHEQTEKSRERAERMIEELRTMTAG